MDDERVSNEVRPPRVLGLFIVLHGAGLLVLAVLMFGASLSVHGVTITALNAVKSLGVFAAGSLVFAGHRPGVWIYLGSTVLHIVQLLLQYAPDFARIGRLSFVYVGFCVVLLLPRVWNRLK